MRFFFRWCIGRGLLERSPADGIALPYKEVARDRTLTDDELALILIAARQIGGPFGGIVEVLALTGQRREEAARMTWDEIDIGRRVWTLGSARTKNGKAHLVHLSGPALKVLEDAPRLGRFVFTNSGHTPFQNFTPMKERLDRHSGVTNWRLHDLRRTVVSGMAQLGVTPHVADRILNHVGGTISGVAAVYQRHEFMAERKGALDLWGIHVTQIASDGERSCLKATPPCATRSMPPRSFSMQG